MSSSSCIKTKTKQTTTVRVVLDKFNNFMVESSFSEHACYFHPIPMNLQKDLREKQIVKGYFAKCVDTGKKDRRGKKIFRRPFIITEKTLNNA